MVLSTIVFHLLQDGCIHYRRAGTLGADQQLGDDRQVRHQSLHGGHGRRREVAILWWPFGTVEVHDMMVDILRIWLLAIWRHMRGTEHWNRYVGNMEAPYCGHFEV